MYIFKKRLPKSSLMPIKKFYMDSPETPYPSILNAASYLMEQSRNHVSTDKILFYTDNNDNWTYKDFESAVKYCAFYLKNILDLQPGERVLVQAYNSPLLAILWFATIYVGGVIILTPAQFKAKELNHILLHSEVSIAFSDADIYTELSSAAKNVSYVRAINTIETIFSLFNDSSSKEEIFFPTIPNDIALIAYTSGSTGTPKATVHTHADIITICKLFPSDIIKPASTDIFAGTAPLGFTFGLGGLLLFPIYYGASSVLLKKPTPENLAQAIKQYKVTTLFSTPTGYNMLLKLEPEHWPSLHTCVSAGAHLPPTTQTQWLNRTGLFLINAIGSTEMLHIFISARVGETPLGATGKPIKGYKAKIVDNDGQTLSENQVGFLAVQGPTGCCYLDNEAAQSKYVQNGWNITGDLFYQDKHGHFYFYDRADDLIITSGYKVSSIEVENALLSYEGILAAAVIAQPDELRGHIIKAYLVLDPQKTPSINIIEINTYMLKTLARYKCPKLYEMVLFLPSTSTGKLLKNELKRCLSSN